MKISPLLIDFSFVVFFTTEKDLVNKPQFPRLSKGHHVGAIKEACLLGIMTHKREPQCHRSVRRGSTFCRRHFAKKRHPSRIPSGCACHITLNPKRPPPPPARGAMGIDVRQCVRGVGGGGGELQPVRPGHPRGGVLRRGPRGPSPDQESRAVHADPLTTITTLPLLLNPRHKTNFRDSPQVGVRGKASPPPPNGGFPRGGGQCRAPTRSPPLLALKPLAPTCLPEPRSGPSAWLT